MTKKQLDKKNKASRPELFKNRLRNEEGKLGWIFLWLIGVPIPILLILFLVRGCT